MKHGGKLAILVIILVAAALGSFGWVWQLTQGRKARAAWGTENSMAIRYGDRAELSRLTAEAPAEGESTRLELGDATVYATDRRVVSPGGDLRYYRQAFVDDYAFDWEKSVANTPPEWTHALEFNDETTTCTLAFDFSRNVVRLVDTGRELHLEKLTAEKLEEFLDEQFQEEDAAVNP